MSPETIGILGIVALFALMILRTPVAFAMLAVGYGGMYLLQGARAASAVMVTQSYQAVSNYDLIVVPMFVLLGNVASQAGFSRALYDAAFAWVGRFRGGLASSSVLGCAVFSAVSGSSVATAVTIGKVAIPEMKRLGYGDGLSTGAIAAGGTLGFLIPPSTGFVLYAILTQQSVGRLFMAGILPGLLLMGLFMATVATIATLNPAAGPRGAQVGLRDRMVLFGRSAPLLGIIALSIGGIYAGIFTPVEASAIGAGLIILLAFALRSLSLRGFSSALIETVRTSAMLYMVVIGADVLNPFLAVTHIPDALGTALTGAGLGPYGTLALIILGYVVLGMFLDSLSMLVVTIPIVFPIIQTLGFDPIWFGVVAVIVVEMGLITPPVGLNVFVVKGVAPEVPMMTIFRGVTPFLMSMIVGLLLIIAFPAIATFIPNSMFGH
ncbi:TRAP transporter large permease [Acidimangrovimonas sediminis]|uniref:TRAP transporter large permease n=1 Tax=Acidimangrovimonas sediminis TaxID=2056283 RepID=UPI000C7F90C8|nr:TRAP transporter large permease [Acidimangrovimonas sediminis]